MSNQALEFDSYLFGVNAVYVEELLVRYNEDPASVDASWREVFDRMASQPSLYPDWAPKTHKIIGVKNEQAENLRSRLSVVQSQRAVRLMKKQFWNRLVFIK